MLKQSASPSQTLFSVSRFVRMATLMFSLFACSHSSAATEAKEAVTHKYTNHLTEETSPYLLQHAHNPVN